MEDSAIPYELPDAENHSFFFIDQHIPPNIEAKLHKHDAWELYCIIHGYGNRMAGDTLQSFVAGDAVLIPPGMTHQWNYNLDSADKNGHVHYLMVAFSQNWIDNCIKTFPEIRNRLSGVLFSDEAIKFGSRNSHAICQALKKMSQKDELGRLAVMIELLPYIFTSTGHTMAGKSVRIEKDIRRMQQICVYVMTHYKHKITLNDAATEVNMNKSAFCTYFKRCKGITFSQYLTWYRLNTACELLKDTKKQISEICYSVGYNDLPHFVRVFTHTYGKSPTSFRKKCTINKT